MSSALTLANTVLEAPPPRKTGRLRLVVAGAMCEIDTKLVAGWGFERAVQMSLRGEDERAIGILVDGGGI
jgi:hypothetical protein